MLAYLLHEGAHSAWQLWAVATVGNTLGGMSTWLLGRWAARFQPQRLATSDKYQKAIARLQRWGSPALLLSWLPFIGDPLCLAAGWLKTPPFSALVYIAIGKGLRYLFVISIA